MKGFIDLFSGIGGFSLAAYWSGLRFDHHYYSEVDPYAISVYSRRFPDATALGDVRRIDYASLPMGEWLVCGGTPCQPHSLAGSRLGSEDERDLWPEYFRAVRKLRPKRAVLENVPGIFTSDSGEYFNRVLSDLASIGYACEWTTISAASIGAPHERERLWIVAYPDEVGCGSISNKPDSNGEMLREKISTAKLLSVREGIWNGADLRTMGLADGVSPDLDAIASLGNSIVPQVAEVIFNLPAFDLWRETVTDIKT